MGVCMCLFTCAVPGLFLDGAMTFFIVIFLVAFRPVYCRLLAERIADSSNVVNQSVETLTTNVPEDASDDEDTKTGS